MFCRVRLGASLVLVCAAAAVSCGGDRVPTSPTQLPTPNSTTPNLGVGVLGVGGYASAPSDYHEPTPPTTDPAPTPDPAPAPAPAPDPAPAPVTISIVGSAGPGAFAPNPLQAAMGNTIVWTNNDATVHRIVLDDGTIAGTIAPGESTIPIAVAAPAVGYRCTFHPSMVGTIQDPAVISPAPEPAPAPAPAPAPLPDDDYDDGYGRY